MGHKHVPQRTCVACRQVRNKRDLIRIVRTPEGTIEVDETGKKSGRGAYLCRRASCWKKALSRGSLDRELRTTVSPDQRRGLEALIETLPEERVEGETEPSV
jgi:predicted RNA-binding protein YlxR (DUF448 family)